ACCARSTTAPSSSRPRRRETRPAQSDRGGRTAPWKTLLKASHPVKRDARPPPGSDDLTSPQRLPPFPRAETMMPQNITTSVKSLVDAAEREVETLSIEDAIKLH